MLREVKHDGSRIAFLAPSQTSGFGLDPRDLHQHQFPGFEICALSSLGVKEDFLKSTDMPYHRKSYKLASLI